MLSEKHIEQGLDHKNERVTKVNYHRVNRNQRYELVDEPKKRNLTEIIIQKELVIKVIMDCRATGAHKFRTKI